MNTLHLQAQRNQFRSFTPLSSFFMHSLHFLLKKKQITEIPCQSVVMDSCRTSVLQKGARFFPSSSSDINLCLIMILLRKS